MTKSKKKNLTWGAIGIISGAFWYNILSQVVTWKNPFVDGMLIFFLVVIPLVGGLVNMFKFFGKDD